MRKEYIKVKISELKPWVKNPKKHDEQLIESSIKEFGYIEPIVVDEGNRVIAGHGRLKVLKKLGIQEVDVIRVEGLSEKQKEKYALIVNRAVERGGWDWEMLNSFEKNLLIDVGFEVFEDAIEKKIIIEENEDKEVSCFITFKNNEEIKEFLEQYKIEDFSELAEYVIVPREVVSEEIYRKAKEIGGIIELVFKNKKEKENFYRLLKKKIFGRYNQIKWEDFKKRIK